MKNCSEKSEASSSDEALHFPVLDEEGGKQNKLARWSCPLPVITRMSEELLVLRPVSDEEFDRRRRSKSEEPFVL